MTPLTGLVLAYLAGSLPTAYVAGRLLRGIDLRRHGSGNLGATNVYRLLGARAAAVVLLVDVAKGAVPVWFLPTLAPADQRLWWGLAYGALAIAGHTRSPFLLWRGGGKGVATATGVFLVLAPVALLGAIAVWSLVLLASGYMSLASLTAAAVLPVAILMTRGPGALALASAAVTVFVFWMHRTNIGRLRRGEEHRFGGRGRRAA